MLLLTRQMMGASIEASDGKVGKLCDLLFDDQTWNVRDLVLTAGSWLNRRRITLPPDVVEHKDWADHRLSIAGLTRQQVIESPGSETHLPVGPAALEEATVVDWDVYWINLLEHPWQVSDDPHLRNTVEVIGYHIRCTDGPIGHITDFVVDDEAWTIRYLLVDTRNWLPGKHVLVAPSRVDDIDGHRREVRLLLPRETVKCSPQYTGQASFDEASSVLH